MYKQYIELYGQTADTICGHSCSVMNARRNEALERLAKAQENIAPATDGPMSENVPLPVGKTFGPEKYAHTDIDALLAPDYGLNLNRLKLDVNPYDVFHCDVPNMSTLLYFLVNDQYYDNPRDNSQSLPEGVFVGGMLEFAARFPEVAAKYYDKLASEHEDGVIALNTVLAQDGFVLYVPENIKVEKPIQLINVLQGDVPFMVNRRLMVIIENGAQAKLLVCDHNLSPAQFLATQVTEVFVGENAFFDIYELEENSVYTNRIASTLIRQAAHSNVMSNGITLTNGVTRNNYYVKLEGEGAETHVSGMAIADGDQHVDNYSFIEHAAPYCVSNELFKYVLNEGARGSFAGRILVREGAVKTEAYQSNKNLCMTDEARMWTRPELEIYCDDVKCSHGATVGQLDQQAIFYMRARGVTEKEAKMLMMFAFMADVIEQVRLEPLKDRLRQLVEKRFRGDLAKCRGCTDCGSL